MVFSLSTYWHTFYNCAVRPCMDSGKWLWVKAKPSNVLDQFILELSKIVTCLALTSNFIFFHLWKFISFFSTGTFLYWRTQLRPTLCSLTPIPIPWTSSSLFHRVGLTHCPVTVVFKLFGLGLLCSLKLRIPKSFCLCGSCLSIFTLLEIKTIMLKHENSQGDIRTVTSP